MTLQMPVMRVLIISSLFAVGLAGCSHLPSMPKINAQTFSPYKIDIQQGNYIDESMVDKLKVGMTHTQVKFIMGTPLVADVFHANRWDYIYTYRKDGALTEQRRVVLIFKDDALESIDKYMGETPVDKSVEAVKPTDAGVQPVKTDEKKDVPAPAGVK